MKIYSYLLKIWDKIGSWYTKQNKKEIEENKENSMRVMVLQLLYEIKILQSFDGITEYFTR